MPSYLDDISQELSYLETLATDGHFTGGVPSHPVSGLQSLSTGTLKRLTSRKTSVFDCPLARNITSNIPIYELPSKFPAKTAQDRLQAEWNSILLTGPGVFVVKKLFPAQALLLSHCVEDPTSFTQYYSNPWLSLALASWLGLSYRITAKSKCYHSDQEEDKDDRPSAKMIDQLPHALRNATQLLSLRGCIAHTPFELLHVLPYSQLPEFQHVVSRDNSSLESLKSACRPNEDVSTAMLVRSCWEELSKMYDEQGWSVRVQALVRATSEGQNYPTEWTPQVKESEQAVLRRCLENESDVEEVVRELQERGREWRS